MSLSAVIITYNEEQNIEQCIQSVDGCSDEIVVVDSYSTDRTKELASKYQKVKFFERAFDDYITQKNFANNLCSRNYIFSLDSDEYIGRELFSFLIQKRYMEFEAISLRRINMICGKKIKFGLWKNDRKTRIWKKDIGIWGGTTPHENIILLPHTALWNSELIFYHNAYTSFRDMVRKSLKYAELASNRYRDKSYPVLWFKMISNPCYKFLKGFVFRLGFLDGREGLWVASASFYETWMKYFLAIKKKRQS